MPGVKIGLSELLAHLSDPVGLRIQLARIRPAELVEVWPDLEADQQQNLLTVAPVALAAELLASLPPDAQLEGLVALPSWRIAELLEEMFFDDLADLIALVVERQPERARHYLGLLSEETRLQVEQLIGYEEDEAGGLMTPEFVALRSTMTVEEVLRFLRRAAPEAEQIYALYVTDPQNRLEGVVSLRDLVLANPRVQVADFMNRLVVTVTPQTDQEEVARLMAQYDLSVLPVVDARGSLVGIVTIDDVVDVIQEEASEDIQALAGVSGPELVYSQSSVWRLWAARVRWLVVLILAGSLTSSILQGFESVLAALTALAFYLPVLTGTGGNTGSQSSTLIIRALATRDLEPGDWWRVLRKEAAVGALLGISLAALLVAKVWLDGQAALLPVVGISLALVVGVANLAGALFPLLLQRLRLDPALVSNPLVATVTDVSGLLIYLSVARWLLGVVTP
jgi:magnesium transporter